MENNLENKARFFALYWGVKCLKNTLLNPDIPSNKVEIGNCKGLPQQFLELTPLSDITDEDAVKLGYGNPSHLKANLLHNIDELRGLGYALPYMGLSVEKLIEYGWVKLKTLNK